MKLELHSADARTAFEPGEEILLLAAWELDSPVDGLEVRLIWFTQGKGTQDVGVAWKHRWERPPLVGNESVQLLLPDGPYSFSGSLISVSWRLELMMLPAEKGVHMPITIAPEGQEVLLSKIE